MRPEDVPHTGLDAVIGLRVTAIDADSLTACLVVTPELLGSHGAVHHGVLSSAIESVASIAAAAHLGDRGHVVGVANATSFFRRASSGTLAVEAEPVSRLVDRQQWLVRVLDQSGGLLAQGNVELADIRDAARLGR
jgi:1,4-dihydroxy-2-naphthoyl-CoA hydrolase